VECGGAGGKESAENTVKNLAGFVCHIERVTGDKETRARPLAIQTEVSNVFLIRGAPWVQKFIDEARDFPVGRHDDMVDAAGGAFNKLALSPRPGATSAAPGLAIGAVPDTRGAFGGGIPDAMSGGTLW
jgi:phage terminase large subunit-like protein